MWARSPLCARIARGVKLSAQALWEAINKGEVWASEGRVALVANVHVQKWAGRGGKDVTGCQLPVYNVGWRFMPHEKVVKM